MSEETARRGIDPRGPRFTAGITSVLLLVAIFLSLTGPAEPPTFGWFAYQPLSGSVFAPSGDFAFVAGYDNFWARATTPAFLMLLLIALLFLWGVISPRTSPWSILYRKVVQPRLRPPAELEDPRPPRFAQGVGLFVVGLGLVLHLLGVPAALTVAGSLAFVAAFLNAAFGVCLGCMMYLLLQRWGLVGRAHPAI
ncbi:DUF4395 domain-containing protein [Microbacterium sp. SLBN-146]|uniref:DUF4395 domain-containing protein n=1 Tax=Microbacterium sp. SLBN-146 TaxID=2768457 RepID=UPI0011540553|nr:DUF4395 domain-containing protein [Microbacterium sp. SLBN-146]TQJ32489.1 uncharacterized protein DUF4395 [Microbacterium sp. SLBN-146]